MDRQDGIYTIDDIFLFFLLMYVNGTGVRIPPTTIKQPLPRMYPNEQLTQIEEEILENMNLRTGDMKQNEFQVILDKHRNKSRIYI